MKDKIVCPDCNTNWKIEPYKSLKTDTYLLYCKDCHYTEEY